MRSFQKRDRRVLVVSRENKGLIYSLNEGVGMARGRWLMRMDADDICKPYRVTRQLDWLNKVQADVCGGAIRTFGLTIPRVRKFFKSSEAIKIQLLFNSCFAHPAVFGRREIFQRFQYQEKDKYVEDYGVWARMAMSGVRLSNCPDVVLDYRIHSEQITMKKSIEQALARSVVANEYRKACFPGFAGEKVHNLIMDRTLSFSQNENDKVLRAFKTLKSVYGNPEKVVSDNAFVYFARHAEVSFNKMRSICGSFRLSPKQCAVLLLLSSLRVNQKSNIYRLLYRLK